MGRKTLWRSFTFTDPNKYNRLQSSLHGLPAFHSGKYVVDLTDGADGLETNLPIRELRVWFRAAAVPWQDHVTDIMPLDERVKEWEADEEEERKYKKPVQV